MLAHIHTHISTVLEVLLHASLLTWCTALHALVFTKLREQHSQGSSFVCCHIILARNARKAHNKGLTQDEVCRCFRTKSALESCHQITALL